ncbi:MAG: protein kinase [Deltaproteobacteria bacterium]|nr:protein kinase [Deltaproteobacteria bacterium]MBW2072072.1 protein kinase [Deltaproteobacteria bacterium]
MSNQKGLLQIGTVLSDKWVILELIGKGGMGEVYQAHQLNLKRDVAIKIISQQWLRSLDGDTEEIQDALKRFLREVQLMAQIRHPNVVQIYDYGSADIEKNGAELHVEYIVMEYIPGATLRFTFSQEGFYPDEEAIKDWIRDYFLPVLDGVQAIHEMGIVHRDLKPENVLLDGRTPKIADLGLARSSRLRPVTRSVDVKGTPPYMSPEHFFDLKSTDQRADIYSLGKILYEAVSGKQPADSLPFKSVKLANTETIFLQELDKIIQNATAEEREDRISSVAVFKQALLEVLDGEVSASATPLTTSTAAETAGWNRQLIAVMLSLIIVGLVGTGIFVFYNQNKQPAGELQPSLHDTAPMQAGEESGPSTPLADQQGSLPLKLQGKDGVTLRLVPGGSLVLPVYLQSAQGKSVNVAPFYMDETQVTNHQYVEFLNHYDLGKLQIKGGVVRHEDGTIWLLLGEVLGGYEPIVFRDGKFQLNDPGYAASPVLRVTAYGAAAYASFYGRRLPTEVEWLFAAGERSGSEKALPPQGAQGQSWQDMDMMMNMMDKMHGKSAAPPGESRDSAFLPTPVILGEPNVYGIRGLNADIGEWGVGTIVKSTTGKKAKTSYVVLGWHWNTPEKGGALPAILLRHPWEAFEEVGFRCAMDAPSR